MAAKYGARAHGSALGTPGVATILIEAAIDSARAAERAVREGAGRLEVCASLDTGGLTPSVELLRHCLALGVPCVAMTRPRAGDFVYNHDELQVLTEHVTTMRDAGAHAIVFGALAQDQTVDDEAAESIVALCAGVETVFHRAFDDTPNAVESLNALIDWGLTRVLTSGQAATAAEGIDTLEALAKYAEGRIEIMPGGGIRAANVVEIVRRTGVSQVHARGTEPGVIAGIRSALDRQH